MIYSMFSHKQSMKVGESVCTWCSTIFSESSVYFPEAVYRVQENAYSLDIPVRRDKDLSQPLDVICYTRDGNNNIKHYIIL